MKNKISYFALVLLAACGSNKQDDLNSLLKKEAELQKQLSEIQTKIKSLRKDSAQPILVSVQKITPQIFKSYLTLQAKVDADDNISLSTEMPGTITKIYVKPGDAVKTGQILAETDSRSLQQSIQALQSNLEFVNELYEKQKKLWEQKVGTEIQYLQTKSQKENLEKTLASLQEQLRMTKIISPIDGTVDAVDIKVGQLVAPGMPAIRVINFNHLKIKADVPENYISECKIGNPVKIILANNDTLYNKLSYVARTINNITRTFNVEVMVGNNPKLHTNQMVVLKINNYTSEKPVIAVPIAYIHTDPDGSQFVYVVENNKVKKKNIKTGKISEDLAEVLSGLNENELLIKAGVNLTENTPVIIQQNSVL
ncbi:MAG: efflux RND transporter periplasmic adaptor subunit [Bacteroidia bacterium]|nr:efflux RND transporter periplasmic adaptor subunit [Bacteroidia bacterium]